MIKSLLSAFVFMLLLSGCSSREEKELVSFVKEYNNKLMSVYLAADLKPIYPFATEKELNKMYPVIQALKAANSVMPATIIKYKVRRAGLGPGGKTAVVETYEEWEYWWEDRSTKQITKPKNIEKYPMRYHLVRDGGGWKVDRLELLEKVK